jgi:hypothetical protein
MIPVAISGSLPGMLTSDAVETDLPFFRRAQRNPVGRLATVSAVGDSRLGLLDSNRSSIFNEAIGSTTIQVSKSSAKTVQQLVPQQVGFEQKIFDSLVHLKVAVATYAMHLPSAERRRIFDRLDALINVEDWHEEDPLPIVESFKNFLKWLVYTNTFDWSSIGVSNEGTILVAWSRPRVAVTANFSTSGRVAWTARLEPEEEGEEPNHAVGSGSLQNFADHARFYLGGLTIHGSHKHP